MIISLDSWIIEIEVTVTNQWWPVSCWVWQVGSQISSVQRWTRASYIQGYKGTGSHFRHIPARCHGAELGQTCAWSEVGGVQAWNWCCFGCQPADGTPSCNHQWLCSVYLVLCDFYSNLKCHRFQVPQNQRDCFLPLGVFSYFFNCTKVWPGDAHEVMLACLYGPHMRDDFILSCWKHKHFTSLNLKYMKFPCLAK